MKKDLPNVFVNPIDKTISNAQEIYYGKNKIGERTVNVDTVLNKINKIFASPYHVYKSKVRITTSEQVLEKEIVGKSNGNLLTLNGEIINIIDIIDIERI